MRPLKIIYAVSVGLGMIVGVSLIRAAVFDKSSVELQQILMASKIFAGF